MVKKNKNLIKNSGHKLQVLKLNTCTAILLLVSELVHLSLELYLRMYELLEDTRRQKVKS